MRGATCETLKHREGESDSELKYETTQMPTTDQNSNNIPNTVGPSCCVAKAQTETKVTGNRSPDRNSKARAQSTEMKRDEASKSEATSE